MKVILTQDIRGKGKRGQMIEVSDGYARNYLFPKKLAQEANADNLNTMRMNDKAKQEREAKERAEREKERKALAPMPATDQDVEAVEEMGSQPSQTVPTPSAPPQPSVAAPKIDKVTAPKVEAIGND